MVEELLYSGVSVHGCALGGYHGLTLEALLDLPWGDLPGQLLWWRDMKLRRHAAENDSMSRK